MTDLRTPAVADHATTDAPVTRAEPGRPFWFRVLDSGLTLLLVSAIACGIGNACGREVGYRKGAADMKAAIFGAIERITKEPTHD